MYLFFILFATKIPVEFLADAPLQLLVVPLYFCLDHVQVGRTGALGGAPRILSYQIQVVQGRVWKWNGRGIRNRSIGLERKICLTFCQILVEEDRGIAGGTAWQRARRVLRRRRSCNGDRRREEGLLHLVPLGVRCRWRR